MHAGATGTHSSTLYSGWVIPPPRQPTCLFTTLFLINTLCINFSSHYFLPFKFSHSILRRFPSPKAIAAAGTTIGVLITSYDLRCWPMPATSVFWRQRHCGNAHKNRRLNWEVAEEPKVVKEDSKQQQRAWKAHIGKRANGHCRMGPVEVRITQYRCCGLFYFFLWCQFLNQEF